MYKSFLQSASMTALFLLITTVGMSQFDTTIKLDLLRAPSSPASSLLGLSNSDIEKPTDVNAFMTSLRNATSNFTVVPKSYAVDLAPFKILGGKYLDAKYLDSNRHRFRQSMVISLGINTVEKNDSVINSAAKTQFGIGVKFPLMRGRIDKASRDAFTRIYALQRTDEALTTEAINNDPVIKKLNSDQKRLFNQWRDFKKNNLVVLADSVDVLLKNVKLEQDKRMRSVMEDSDYIKKAKALEIDDLNGRIKKEVAKIKLERVGFNLDFSAGTVIDFINNKLSSSYITKTGAWLTGGYTDEKTSSSLLFIVRYLYNPKTALADPNLKLEKLHTLDFGGRFVATPMEKKLLLSMEAIYRSILNKANATSSYRLIFNAEYEIGVNQRLTFSFGRNFDGETYKGGNVISALSLLLGFGKQKIPMNGSQQ